MRNAGPAIVALSLRLRCMLRDTRGATAIEYALIASGVSLAIMSTVWSLGSQIKTTFYDKLANLF